MSFSLNSLKGRYIGLIKGTPFGVFSGGYWEFRL